jgi:hypothetical protein
MELLDDSSRLECPKCGEVLLVVIDPTARRGLPQPQVMRMQRKSSTGQDVSKLREMTKRKSRGGVLALGADAERRAHEQLAGANVA